MPTLSPQAQALITAFGRQPGVTQDQVQNLKDIINGSPALVDQFNDAVAQGHLRQVVPLANANAGGEYDPIRKEMRLPLSRLTSPPDAGDMTFVLGHELQHGFNRIATRQALTDFAKDVRQIAKSDSAPRDYTAPAAALLAQNRRDEATAEIAGWNAIVSRVKPRIRILACRISTMQSLAGWWTSSMSLGATTRSNPISPSIPT